MMAITNPMWLVNFLAPKAKVDPFALGHALANNPELLAPALAQLGPPPERGKSFTDWLSDIGSQIMRHMPSPSRPPPMWFPRTDRDVLFGPDPSLTSGIVSDWPPAVPVPSPQPSHPLVQPPLNLGGQPDLRDSRPGLPLDLGPNPPPPQQQQMALGDLRALRGVNCSGRRRSRRELLRRRRRVRGKCRAINCLNWSRE